MSLLTAIAAWSVLAFGLLLFVFQLGVHEFGYQIGRRHAARRAYAIRLNGKVIGLVRCGRPLPFRCGVQFE